MFVCEAAFGARGESSAPRSFVRALVLAALVAVCLACSCLPGAEAGGNVQVAVSQEIPKTNACVLAEAKRHLSLLRSSTYQHHADVDENAGRYNLDCSGFAALVLSSAAPRTLAATPFTGKNRHLAVDFHTAIVASPPAGQGGDASGWKRIANVADVRPGDLAIWVKANRQPGDSSGHVMIVSEAPERVSTSLARLRVIDSTSRPHGEDTRPEGASGLGEGTIWLELDAAGAPLGYRASSPTSLLNPTPIIFGRPCE